MRVSPHGLALVRIAVAGTLLAAGLPGPASGQLPGCPNDPLTTALNLVFWEWDHTRNPPGECRFKSPPQIESSRVECKVTAMSENTNETVWADLIIKKENGEELLRCRADYRQGFSEDERGTDVQLPADTRLICQVKRDTTRQPPTRGGYKHGTMGCAVY